MKKKRQSQFVLWKNKLTKMFLVMRIVSVMLFAFVLGGYSSVLAQQKVNVNFKDVTYERLFDEIRKQTGVVVMYNSDVLDKNLKVRADFGEIELEDLLSRVLSVNGFSYRLEDDFVIVVKDEKKTVNEENVFVKIRGKVLDLKKEPLPGVSIVIKGTTLGVVTDSLGRFQLPPLKDIKDVVVVFSFVGMETKEVKLSDIKDEEILAGKKDYEITLVESTESLDDVVVTGYANVRKESYTGTAVRVEGEELLKVANRNVISALQVFDPSFRIMENNAMGSNPNAIPEFYIRGQSGIGNLSLTDISESRTKNNPNLPVFILDGLEVGVEKIYDMDPTRIHSITILKDAAATAVYGSRASNGVVVIETIAPKAGKFNITYNLTGSITAPDLTSYDYFEAAEKLEVEKLAGYYELDPPNRGVRAVYAELMKKQMAIAKGVNTDWLALPLRVGYNHKHSIAIDGGDDNIRYGINFFYDNQKGVMKKDLRRRLGAELRIDYRLSNLNVINRASFNKVTAKASPYGSFADYVKQLPYNELYDKFGHYLYHFVSWHTGAQYINPMYEGAETQNYDNTISEEFADNLLVDWYLNEHWNIKAQIGFTRQIESGKDFVDPASGQFYNVSDEPKGTLTTTEGKSYNWTTNLQVLYNRSIGVNYISGSLGLNTTENITSTITVNYKGFPSGNLSSVMYAQEVNGKPTETDNHTRLVGAFARLNYSYNDVYLFDGSLRFDGSSEFGSDKKFAPFWSAGVGVNFHNYKFLKDNPILTQLKITGTYGQTGKLNFEPYAAKDIYEVFSDKWYATGMGVKLMALGNSDLKWEKKNSYDLKLEVNLCDGLFYAELAYYYARTKDMITTITIPSSFGFTSYYDNLGEVENVGYELNVRSDIVRTGDWYVSLYGNMAHNKNKILKIANSLKHYNEMVDDYYSDYDNGQSNQEKYAESFTKYEEGGSTTSIFGMKSLGIDPASGQEVFVRKDGTITYEWEANEQQILGNSLPNVQGAFGLNLQWKTLTLFASFMYECGGQVYNTTLPTKIESVDLYNYNADRRVLSDRWIKIGDVTPLKDIADRSSYSRPTSRFVQDNNVLEFNSLSLSWVVREGFVKKLKLNQLKLQFTMNDVAHWSSIRQERGTSYPFARNFDFTLGISF